MFDSILLTRSVVLEKFSMLSEKVIWFDIVCMLGFSSVGSLHARVTGVGENTSFPYSILMLWLVHLIWKMLAFLYSKTVIARILCMLSYLLGITKPFPPHLFTLVIHIYFHTNIHVLCCLKNWHNLFGSLPEVSFRWFRVSCNPFSHSWDRIRLI